MGTSGASPDAAPAGRGELVVCADAQALADEAARRFVSLASQVAAAGRDFCVALSGGKTPAQFLQTLASGRHRDAAPWARVHLFWSDERAVPPQHPDSNYGMAQRELFAHVPLRQENIHRMEAERADLDAAAREYEAQVRRVVPAGVDGIPRMDLIYLGIGADGHTASLFPGSPALDEKDRLVVAARDPHGAPRMTFTLPLLHAARNVIFLAAGKEKVAVLRAVLGGQKDLPAARVAPAGALLYLVDRAAAGELANPK
jgi:6-phosphogluconolactonase